MFSIGKENALIWDNAESQIEGAIMLKNGTQRGRTIISRSRTLNNDACWEPDVIEHGVSEISDNYESYASNC